jgi:2-methylisocitrate lyase-like PEP mutase family enzyme
MLEAARDENQILPMACSYDALSSKPQAAGFPVVFLSGFVVAASLGLPDTGYVAFGEMTQKISEVARQVDVPILVDGDTGYGGPMNVKRTVQG